MDIMNQENTIHGGDLNFSLGRDEIWGSISQVDPLSYFFIQRMEENILLDIERIKLNLLGGIRGWVKIGCKKTRKKYPL
jgi:hypothetical protein